MSIYEAIGIAYTILATTLFTAQLVYLCSKALNNVRRLIELGEKEEKNLRLQRPEIERGLAKAS